MEKPTRNKALLVIAIVLTLGVAWIGWKYWGWFRTEKDKWIFDCIKKMQDSSMTIPDYKSACEKQWEDEHKNTEEIGSVPNTFYGIHCGGAAPTSKVKWYKESDKYYSILEPLSNTVGGYPPKANEVSEETYRWAYKQVKKGCGDMVLPRMANEEQSFAEGGRVSIVQPPVSVNQYQFSSLSNQGSNLKLYGKNIPFVPQIGQAIDFVNKTTGNIFKSTWLGAEETGNTTYPFAVKISWNGAKIPSNTYGYITW